MVETCLLIKKLLIYCNTSTSSFALLCCCWLVKIAIVKSDIIKDRLSVGSENLKTDVGRTKIALQSRIMTETRDSNNNEARRARARKQRNLKPKKNESVSDDHERRSIENLPKVTLDRDDDPL